MLCFGLPLAASILLPALDPATSRGRTAVAGAFAAGWLPVTAVLLLAWPEWSWWYFGPIVQHPEWGLPLGVAAEVAGFVAGLALAARLSPSGRRSAAIGAVAVYALLLVAPWGLWGHVGTPGARVAAEAPWVWASPALLVTLGLGGGWLVAAFALAGGLRRAGPAAVAALLLVGCGAPPEVVVPDPIDPPVAISIAHDADRLADRWRRAMKDELQVVPPDVQLRDVGLAFSEVIERRVDAAIVLRRATAAEDRFAAGDDLVADVPLHYEVLARLPVALFVHKDNPVEVIDLEEATRVVSGALREWGPLGGPDRGEIGLYGRAPGTSTAALVSSYLLAGRPPATQLRVLPSDAAVAQAVASDPLGFGVGGGAPVRGTRTLAVRDGEDMLMPGAGTGGRPWPMVRDVYLVTRGEPERRVRAFLEFARSDAGGVVAEGSGFIAWTEAAP